MTVHDDVVVPMRCRCRLDGPRAAHHDRLLTVETDPDELLELLELAVTWRELDWAVDDVVPPETWVDFAAEHPWADAERMARLFGLAADIALRTPAPADAAGVAEITARVARGG